MFQTKLNCIFALLLFVAFLFMPHAGYTQNGNDDLLFDDLFPPQATAPTVTYDESSLVDSTHPIIRLTPDKSEIVHLNKNAKSIIIGNPQHLNILMESPKTLVLIGRDPGATHFTILDDDDRIIMQRHAIIAAPTEKYVRIRRSCINATGSGCEDMSVYYCPDMCHQVSIMYGDGAGASVSTTASPAVGPVAGAVQQEMGGGQ